MGKGKLQIHSDNILPIIKKWLYTDKEIFLRELVSNACDALFKLKTLSELKETDADESTFRIEIKTDKSKKTITISDNGLGMTSDEVERYIAQIAFSGAREFVEKYETKKSEDQIIGHFGLGFFSSYMVAKSVDIHTLSYKKGAEPVLWSCEGSSEYTLEKGTRTHRGTDIILHIAEEEEEYLEPNQLRTILDRYCAYLTFPFYLNDVHVNKNLPLWIKGTSECTESDYTDFYQKLFPLEDDPLFWVHLNVDYPFHLKGILYFPKLSKENELKKEGIRLFCNRVFVSGNCNELFPDYLTLLRGVIDSPDIPLNVSRSTLQTDRTVKQLGQHISKKISDRLTALYRNEREKFLSIYEEVELVLKLGSIQDEKFYEKIKECLIWKNSKGEWSTVEEYLERNPGGNVYYASESQESSHFLNLFNEKGIEVLIVSANVIHQVLVSFLERKLNVKFQRIDGGIIDQICDPSKDKILLDNDGKTEATKMADFIRSKLPDIQVEAKSLANETLPALLVLNEDERRMRDAMVFRNKEFGKILRPTFVVNTNSKLVNAIYKLNEKDPNLAQELVHSIYDLTCLSQKEMVPETLSKFVIRSTEVFEKLATMALDDQ